MEGVGAVQAVKAVGTDDSDLFLHNFAFFSVINIKLKPPIHRLEFPNNGVQFLELPSLAYAVKIAVLIPHGVLHRIMLDQFLKRGSKAILLASLGEEIHEK